MSHHDKPVVDVEVRDTVKLDNGSETLVVTENR
jgi:hypothetical protein